MNKVDIVKLTAIYIWVIGKEGAPSSHILLAVDPTMTAVHGHMLFLQTLEAIGVVEVKNYFVTLTPKGLEMWKDVVEAVEEVKAKKADKGYGGFPSGAVHPLDSTGGGFAGVEAGRLGRN